MPEPERKLGYWLAGSNVRRRTSSNADEACPTGHENPQANTHAMMDTTALSDGERGEPEAPGVLQRSNQLFFSDHPDPAAISDTALAPGFPAKAGTQV
jgi:hypothetical protein